MREEFRTVDGIIGDNNNKPETSVPPLEDDIPVRKRQSSFAPVKRHRSPKPFAPPKWETFYKPMKDDREVGI